MKEKMNNNKETNIKKEAIKRIVIMKDKVNNQHQMIGKDSIRVIKIIRRIVGKNKMKEVMIDKNVRKSQ